MTLLVGIQCKDGVVMASDSAATFGADGQRTIGQQHVTKLRLLADCILYAGTGAVGMGQGVADTIEQAWRDGKFANVKTPASLMQHVGQCITQTVAPYLHTGGMLQGMKRDPTTSLVRSLVAMPCKRAPCLFTFDYNGAPEQASKDLPFVAHGSGQAIADPFLAFLKRLLWKDTEPTIAEGRLVAAWTIDHVAQTNPGGVGGAIQMGVLAASSKEPKAELYDDVKVDEHLQAVQAAEQALVEHFHPSEEEVPDPPKGPVEQGE